jgi:hypothetical protein
MLEIIELFIQVLNSFKETLLILGDSVAYI